MKKKLSGRLSRKVFKTNFLLTMKAMAIFAFCFSLRVSAAVNPEDNKPANLADEANSSSAFQQLTITGSVTDANTGEPLPGVNIVIEGTTMGAITEADGNYSIDVPSESAVLVFSYVGYTTQRVETSGRTQINIFLSSELKALDEVVVVGYGTQRREAVTGSVASMHGEEILDVPSSDVTQALQGRMAGVEMSRNSTKPGAEMQIRIRGTRSLNATNDPLVVVDGAPFGGNLSDLDLNNIAAIDILKDASATAIYGSRGANGVILITTRKGLRGQKAQATYNAYVGMKKVFAPYPMMDGPEFVALRAARGQFTNGVDESDDVNTDWQSLLYRTAMVNSHDLGVSGGSAGGSYSVGVGYYNEEAVLPGQNFSRFSMHGTFDQAIGKSFRFGLTTNSNYSVNNGNNLDMYGLLSTTAIADPYNADGTLKRTVKMPLDENWVYTKETVENLGDSWIDQTKAFGSYNNMYGEVKIPGIEGLKYRINLALSLRTSNSGSYTGEGVFSYNPTNPSTASISNSLGYHWLVENLLTYDRTFAEKHQVNFVGLYSAEQARYNKSTISAKDIPADAFQFYNLGRAAGEITINPDSAKYSVSGLKSWMGRVQYSYDRRYMLMASVRSDGSSRLAEGHKWHTYPAVSVGWNIGNESFMQAVNWIDMLKLRLGYGQTSNQAIAPYSTLGLLNTRPYNFGPTTYSVGYYVSQLPNPSLGWEYSDTYNYGLDFAVLNGRLSGTVEYYVVHTKDILLSLNLPNTSGVSSYTANIGETENKGVELSLNGVILQNLSGWTWEVGFNLYANRNKLVALASGKERDEANSWFVGYPIDSHFDYEKIGLWQASDPYLDILEPGGNVGMIKVKYTGDYDDVTGEPVRQIGPDDRQIIPVEPDFQGGFNTRLSYKGFDLSAIGVFRSGGILYSSLYAGNGYLNLMTGRRQNVKVDYWTPTNTGAKYPAPDGVLSGDNPKYANTLGIFDASYLKIRTISLGYSFDRIGWVKNNIGKLRLYVMAENPFVMFSPYKKESGMDPETNSYANQNAAVPASDNLKRFLTIGTNTPSTRNYLIGINLSF
jgi:TonB-linked SusC/RagA family outer membrane protein